jgi:hypothetical protein
MPDAMPSAALKSLVAKTDRINEINHAIEKTSEVSTSGVGFNLMHLG